MDMADVDPNDAFEAIFMAEERLREEGFQDGFRDGTVSGQEEGVKLGSEHGANLGMELGFYQGFAATWYKLLSSDGQAIHSISTGSKVLKVLHQLKEMVDSFSIDNPKNIDMDQLNKIRAKFKQVASQLDISPSFGIAQPSGISF